MPITDLKDHFTLGGTAVNGWCAIPSPITAEILGRAGFDMVTVDLQHGLIDYQMALTMCQVLQGLPAPVLCRVPWNEPGIIMKCLDAGFTGLICPMINTKEDARRLVEAARYAPVGGRSFGPTRANMVHGATYARNANEKVLVLAMIGSLGWTESTGSMSAPPTLASRLAMSRPWNPPKRRSSRPLPKLRRAPERRV